MLKSLSCSKCALLIAFATAALFISNSASKVATSNTSEKMVMTKFDKQFEQLSHALEYKSPQSPEQFINSESTRFLQDDHEDFVEYCYTSLTGPQSTEDGLITTTDVYNFIRLVDHDGTHKSFDGLDIYLQLQWMWALCPPTSGEATNQCLDEMKEMYNDQLDYGFQLSPDTSTSVFEKIRGFCEKIYPSLKSAYDSSLSPSNTRGRASISPSVSPSKTLSPSRLPSWTPSLSQIPTQSSNIPTTEPPFGSPSMSPSVAPSKALLPSRLPSWTPSLSQTPTMSISPTTQSSSLPSLTPSSKPTLRSLFEIKFKFVMGFDNAAFNALKLTAELAMGDEGIIEGCKATIINVLTAANITTKERRFLRRMLVAFDSTDAGESIMYVKALDVKCPSIFNDTTSSCVLVEWKVMIEANPYEYDGDRVSAVIFDPIRESMLPVSSEFLDVLDRSEVEEVMFVGDGPYNSEDGDESTIGTSSRGAQLSLSALLGVILCICGFVLFICWRKRKGQSAEEQTPAVVSGRQSLSP